MIYIPALICRYIRARKDTQEKWKNQRDDKIRDGGSDRQQRKTGAAGHADPGNEPDRGGSCEPCDSVPSHKYQARAYETNAGDNLRSYSGRIEHNAISDQNIRKAILRDQQKKGSGGTYDRISAKSRALVADLAFQPDCCRK
jgi:hypothetical protein